MLSINISDILLVVAALTLSALVLTTLHWFPWGKELSRPISYALGTVVTVGIPVGAMLLAMAMGLTRGELFWAGLLTINALWSGLMVLLCYWIDSKKPLTLDEVATDARAEY